MLSLKPTSLEQKISGSVWSTASREFLTNAAVFPILNAVLDLAQGGLSAYLADFPHLLQIPAAAIQAVATAWWQPQSPLAVLAFNLIGPAMYTVFDFLLEGFSFLHDPLHATYWGFALLAGLIRAWRAHAIGLMATATYLLENVARISLFSWLYWLMDSGITQGQMMKTWGEFISKPDHLYVLIGAALIGLMLGASEAQVATQTLQLRHLARQLQRLSEFSFERKVVEQALEAPTQVLQPRRATVAPLFLDVRGFTAWSATTTPEKIVALLNRIYEEAEAIILRSGGSKPIFVADEVITLFDDPVAAVTTALQLNAALSRLLAPYGLGIGIGVHYGEVVRGLLGSKRTRKFDAVGDTMNTASRLEEAAEAGQVLLSEAVYQQVRQRITCRPLPPLNVKGKPEPLRVYEALALK